MAWMIVPGVVRAYAQCHSISSGIVRYSKSNASFVHQVMRQFALEPDQGEGVNRDSR